VRLFVAIDFPQDMLLRIEQIVSYFKTKTPPPALKWVETKHMHLTIKFIGEIGEDKLEPIEESLVNTLAGQSHFDIEVGGLGMYPHKDNPRVIWLGITGGEPLIRMHSQLDQHLASLDVKREGRSFSPHLTIARVRRHADQATVKSIGQTLSLFNVDPLGTVTIDRVQLYQSVLTPSGPIYTSLLSIPLNKV